MVIDKIEIESFGKFKDFSMSFSEGINVLCGLNESGKSTICAFLYAMFYDLPSSKQKYTLRDDLRKRYMPWSGGDMKGSVYFTHEEKKYVLKRRMGKTPRSTKLNLYDGDTWEEIKDERCENPGEAFFGIGEDGFLKTIYISQLGAPIKRGKNDEIIERLSNLRQSGDEDVSYQKTVDILKKQKYSLVSVGGGAGKLVKLKEENEELKEKYKEVILIEESYKKAVMKKNDEEKRKESLLNLKETLMQKKSYAEEFKKYQIYKAKQDDIERLSGEKERLTADILESDEKLRAIKERKEELLFLDNIEESATQILAEIDARNVIAEQKLHAINERKEETKRLRDKLRKLSAQKESRVNYLMLSIAVVLFLAGLVLTFTVSFWAIFLAVCGLGLGLLSFIPSKSFKEKEEEIKDITLKIERIKPCAEEENNILTEQKKNREKAEEIFKAAHCHSLSELLKKLSEKDTIDELLKSGENENNLIRENLKRIECDIEKLKSETESADFSDEIKNYSQESSEEIESQLANLQNELILCEKKLSEAETMIGNLEKSEKSQAEIKTQIGINEEKITELEKIYNATQKALMLIEESYEDLKSDFAPILSLKVKDAVKRLTGGKYTDVRISDDYTLKVLYGNDIIDADFLSGGTYDSLYLALRMGILKILFKDKIPFLILDDTFLQFDDERTSLAANYIKDEKIKQVLYFTCHKEQTTIFGIDNINVINF